MFAPIPPAVMARPPKASRAPAVHSSTGVASQPAVIRPRNRSLPRSKAPTTTTTVATSPPAFDTAGGG
jgi:hypothetical protein